MKVLVLGGSGLLGREILKVLGPIGIGTYFSRPFSGGIYLKTLEGVINAVKPSVCINCVVERTVDTCENDWSKTKNINIDFVDELSKLCTSLSIHLIHISTEYVFDGRKPPYIASSSPNPLQNYGISKLISELRIYTVPKNTIIRVPVLYGPGPLGDSAITLIGHKVLDKTRTYTEDDAYPRYPVFVPDLAKFIVDAVMKEKLGIIHFTTQGPAITKFQIAKLIGKFLNKTIEHIKPGTTVSATRPFDTQLIGYSEPSTLLEEGLSICFEKLYHPPLKGHVSDVFIAIDLDGTIVDSDNIHLECYQKVKPDFEWSDVTPELRDAKYAELSKCNIDFMPGANSFIEWIYTNNISHCVVTNTDQRTVDLFKGQLPLLNKLQNWITRECYDKPKPDGEPYKLAVDKFGKGKKYIIGIENSEMGYKSLCSITECIYIIGDDKVGDDVYRISSLDQILG